jgi:hypothetical protein
MALMQVKTCKERGATGGIAPHHYIQQTWLVTCDESHDDVTAEPVLKVLGLPLLIRCKTDIVLETSTWPHWLPRLLQCKSNRR